MEIPIEDLHGISERMAHEIANKINNMQAISCPGIEYPRKYILEELIKILQDKI